MKVLKKIAASLFLITASFASLEGTPTSLFWTNCTTEVLDQGMGKIDVDDYFSVWNRRHHGEHFATDVGFELGLYTWNNIKLEAGIDYLGGDDDPLLFNAKIGVEQDKLFCYSPSMALIAFDFGTRHGGPVSERTNYNTIGVIFGRSLPSFIGGNFYAGGFHGNRAMGKNQGGFWVGYERFFCPAKDCCGEEYNKWEFSADYASGKNVIGGGGFSLGYYFTPRIMVQTGPTWFNSAKLLGTWKWAIQLHIEIPVFTCNNNNQCCNNNNS